MRIPKLLISAGAMKAGTSWLFNQLKNHPQINVTPIKEVHFFIHMHSELNFLSHAARLHNLKTYMANCEVGRSIDQIRRDILFFERYMQDPINDRWFKNLYICNRHTYRAEFSNMTSLLSESGFQHVRSIAGKVRVIYILRDPILRLLSHVKFHIAVNNELNCLESFDEDSFCVYARDCGALMQSLYMKNITRMKKYFSSSELKIVFFEDMISQPRHQISNLYHFLEVSDQPLDELQVSRIINQGPMLPIPEKFVHAARAMLSDEIKELQDNNLFHSSWMLTT